MLWNWLRGPHSYIELCCLCRLWLELQLLLVTYLTFRCSCRRHRDLDYLRGFIAESFEAMLAKVDVSASIKTGTLGCAVSVDAAGVAAGPKSQASGACLAAIASS